MKETAALQILVTTSGSKDARRELDSLTKSAAGTEKAVGGLTSVFMRLAGPLLTAGTLLAAFNKTLSTTVAFETFKARLETATGSVEAANQAFAALIEFANETPYGLEQATNAFIQLKNRGLVPSEQALRAYGNTAYALGYSLEDLAYAVSATAAGEFEPLRKLGIQARKEADGLAITFQGVTTHLKNNIAEIQGYFISLGENQFGGAMEKGMDTLKGKISQLGDAWDQLFNAIGAHGFGDVVSQSISVATEAITRLQQAIESGELVAVIEAFTSRFDGMAQDVTAAFDWIVDTLGTDTEQIGEILNFLAHKFLDIPNNARASVQQVGALFALLAGYVKTTFENVGKIIFANWEFIFENVKNLAKEADSYFSGQDFDYAAALEASVLKYANTVKGSVIDIKADVGTLTEAWLEQVIAIERNRRAENASFEERIKHSQDLRKAYEFLTENQQRLNNAMALGMAMKQFSETGDLVAYADALKRIADTQDRLSQGATASTNTMQTEAQRRQFEDLEAHLKGEENAVWLSYDRRREIIVENTKDNADLQAQLLSELDTRAASELLAAQQAKADRMEQYYEDDQKILENRLALKEITDEEFRKMSLENWAKYQKQLGDISNVGAAQTRAKQMQTNAMVLNMAADLSQQLSALAQKGSDEAKVLFYVSKAISIAQAIVNTELAATAALTAGPFLGIPMSSLVRATGYASAGIIAATTIAAYDQGGIVPGNSYSGDKVHARVNSGEMILNDAQQTELWKAANGEGSGGGGVKVVVNNYSDGTATVKETQTADGRMIEITVAKAVEKMTSDVTRGEGPFPKALQRSYGLKRTGENA